MRPLDFVIATRDGTATTSDDLRAFLEGAVCGEVPAYQVTAWLMAVFFRGMDAESTAALTQAMIASGKVMDLSSLPGPLVDKHSTGGVGDKISLVLAPLAAACGLQVPMMSGRSLGHTGGTLDKLDSIPGYRSVLSEAEFASVIGQCGFAMTGQSADIVPADRLLYALRDASGTVESIPLITASILSKKFAEGARALVMDITCGRGAFMKTPEQAKALAQSMAATAKVLDRPLTALITSMNRPRGRKVGNFLEVEEALDVLEGGGPDDVRELSLRLCAWMLVMGGKAATADDGHVHAARVLAGGQARELFFRNVSLQGGDCVELERLRGRFRAPVQGQIVASVAGTLQDIDAMAVGRAATLLGAGRSRAEDRVFPDVGVEIVAECGQDLGRGDLLCRYWARTDAAAEQARQLLTEAYKIGQGPATAEALILGEYSFS